MFMSTQISLKLSDNLLKTARKYAENKGFENLQDFIRETLRQKLFEGEENIGGAFTYLASEDSLSRNYLSKSEDEAWKHLQKAT